MTDEELYHPLPQPEELSEREKEDAMGAYLMMFASIGAGLPLPIVNLIASIVYFSVNAKKSRFIRFHCHQSLISQVPTTLLNAGLLFWTLQIWVFDNVEFNNVYLGYLIMVIVFNLAYFVLSIVAAIRARKGRMYYFLLFGNLSYEHAFRKRAGVNDREQETPVNRPPGQ
jgi:uncharacterized membrane protein